MSRATGNAAEQRAARFLEELGYTILRKNYTCRLGEIDLVCEDAETLCFIEVRYRRVDRFGEAIETITPEKRRRILRAARDFVVRHNVPESREMRFDVVTIHGDEEPRLVRNAFGSFFEEFF